MRLSFKKSSDTSNQTSTIGGSSILQASSYKNLGSNTLFSKHFFIVVGIVVVLVGIVPTVGTMLVLNSKYKNRITFTPTGSFASLFKPKANPTPDAPTPLPTPNGPDPETNDWEELILENLTFKVPTSWWFEEHVDSVSGSKWINIDLTLPFPSGAEANQVSFVVTYAPNSTIAQKKRELTDKIGLVVSKEEKLTQADITITKITGKVSSGAQKGKTVYVALYQVGRGVYYLVDYGLVDNHETYYSQMLSTFKF